MVDENKSGKVLDIEILDAKENITAFDPHKDIITNLEQLVKMYIQSSDGYAKKRKD